MHFATAVGFPRFTENHFAHRAALDEFCGLAQKRCAADLRTHLHHAVIFACRSYRNLAFENVVAGRLFHVNIFSRQTSMDGQLRVPVIGCGHHERARTSPALADA